MSVTWHNIYRSHVSGSFQDYESAALFESRIGVEQRWNGHLLSPCVGMRAEQASHLWKSLIGYHGDPFLHLNKYLRLEPRHD